MCDMYSGIFPSLAIGYFSLSLSLPGYRHIHLTCSGNGLENASLYVHVGIMDYIGATGKASKAPFKTRKNREVCVCVYLFLSLCVCVREKVWDSVWVVRWMN